jgi:putative oligomerization/nucleic acid binding protein
MFRARRIMRRRAVAGYAAKRGAGAGREEHVPAEAPPAPAPGHAEQLRELTELREQGLLTEEEFAAEKKKLLRL